MKTKQKEKSFDAVKMMRDARNKITAETQNMKFDELKKYIDNQLKNSGLKPIGLYTLFFFEFLSPAVATEALHKNNESVLDIILS